MIYSYRKEKEKATPKTRKETKMKKNLTVLATFVGKIIGWGIIGIVATLCYSKIAYEFNLPEFNFWVITGTCYVLNRIISPEHKGEE